MPQIKKIRIGKGSFNNIVIDDESVLMEHCNIIFDDKGCRVVNIHREAETFINGEKIQWEAELCLGDELRVGSVVISWDEILESIKAEPISDMENMDQATLERKIEKKVAWISSLFYLIYFFLAFFVIYSLVTGKTFLIVLSSILFGVFLLYNIYCSIMDFKNRKNLTDIEKLERSKYKKYKYLLLLALIPVFIKFHSKYSHRFDHINDNSGIYNIVVTNESEHQVAISYFPLKDTSISPQVHSIAQGESYTIAPKKFVSNSHVSAPWKGDFVIIFDDTISVIHTKDDDNRYSPSSHNILSGDSWVKSSSNKEITYTITLKDYEEACSQNSSEYKQCSSGHYYQGNNCPYCSVKHE